MNAIQSINVVDGMLLFADKCLKSLRFCSGRQHPRGQTTVEFALIVLPFFAILFAIIDYAQIYFYQNSLQNAMRETARFTTAGRIIQAYNSDGTPAYETNNGVAMPKAINGPSGEASRYTCSRWWFMSNCIIAIPVTNIVITSASTLPGAPPVTSTNSVGRLTLLAGYTVTTNASSSTVTTNTVPAVPGPGNANDYVQIQAHYTINTITPGIGYLSGYDHGGWNAYDVSVSSIVKNEPALLNFLHPATNSGDTLP
ncbi:MAG: pilus assembly protein [Methylacidiphilales bacterium]|nr:pilus assembly protein [Candidatus Methylacidiphilales bacterium]